MLTQLNLNIGEIRTTRDQTIMACYGLGSCVAVFLQDRLRKISSGAHVMLSGLSGKNTSFHAEEAIAIMLREIEAQGGDIRNLKAKLVGGANLFQGSTSMGEKNYQSLYKLLTKHKVFVASQDVGGAHYRTAHFNTQSGEVSIRHNQKQYSI